MVLRPKHLGSRRRNFHERRLLCEASRPDTSGKGINSAERWPWASQCFLRHESTALAAAYAPKGTSIDGRRLRCALEEHRPFGRHPCADADFGSRSVYYSLRASQVVDLQNEIRCQCSHLRSKYFGRKGSKYFGRKAVCNCNIKYVLTNALIRRFG